MDSMLIDDVTRLSTDRYSKQVRWNNDNRIVRLLSRWLSDKKQIGGSK